MKTKITLGIVITLGLIITNVTASPRHKVTTIKESLAKIPVLNLRQPFVLYLEKITEQDIAACQADENCIDIMPIKEHITRNEWLFLKRNSDIIKRIEQDCDKDQIENGCATDSCCEAMHPYLPPY